MSKHRTTALSGKVEWYTPPDLLAAVREGMGAPFDVDPASCEVANRLVQAKRYYTKEDNALGRPWFRSEGERLWLNPPYARGMMKPFSAQWVAECRRFEATQAAMLVNADTGTKWFHALLEGSNMVFVFKQRLAFYNPDLDTFKAGNSYAQALFYNGPYPQWVGEALREYNGGFVVSLK